MGESVVGRMTLKEPVVTDNGGETSLSRTAVCALAVERYRLLERGYVVYSIGSDEADDGGIELPLRKGSDKGTRPPYDITFIVER